MKTALVTGCAKGIGRAIALQLAHDGYNIVINYLTSFEEAESLSLEITSFGSKAIVVKCDVSNEEDVDKMFKEIEKEFGGVDVLVNNAAVDLSCPFSIKKIDDFKRTLDVNLIGAFNTSKRAYKYMLEKKWGRIINISSTNGIDTYYPDSLEYDASKAGLISLTHNLAYEFAPYINVNAVCPGFIGTKSELEGYTEDFLKSETEKIFVKRIGKEEDVANVVSFLVSDKADFINNSIIRVDGGQY